MEAVTNQGYSLKYSSEECQNDKTIVLKAVTGNGHALGFAKIANMFNIADFSVQCIIAEKPQFARDEHLKYCCSSICETGVGTCLSHRKICFDKKQVLDSFGKGMSLLTAKHQPAASQPVWD